MKLLDVLQRTTPPLPWQEGDNIPWHEPDFSRRMLAEHLTQNHDRASRRSHIIDSHVQWIHQTLLAERPAGILDLGCGPGLYCNSLAALGHQCKGIDYSPASIGYALQTAQETSLPASYLLADIRSAEFGSHYDLVMLLFGELNVFSRNDAAHILVKTFAALRPGGALLLEPHVYSSLKLDPVTQTRWFSSDGGLFSPMPHQLLLDQYWDQDLSIQTIRYYVVDVTTAEVTRFAQSMQAYTTEQYQTLLNDCGFTEISLLPGVAHDRISATSEFHAIIARKPV